MQNALHTKGILKFLDIASTAIHIWLSLALLLESCNNIISTKRTGLKVLHEVKWPMQSAN